jgi:maltose O-acetyltransferase
LTIGQDAVIAAGSVVTMDVPDHVLVAGVPARMLARVDETFDWSRAM